jgi:hypothetical protein
MTGEIIMAKLLVPQVAAPVMPLFYNVEGVVGAAPAQNKKEDVLLVQFGLQKGVTHPKVTADPTALEALKAVKLTGSADVATINAIRVVQTLLKTSTNSSQVVDGRVSPAQGYDYGGGVWVIGQLNIFMKNANKGIWPRIDKLTGCPDDVKTMVTRTLAGT